MQMAWVPGFFHDGYLYAAFGKNAAELGKWLVPHLNDFEYSRFEQHLPTYFILEGLFFKLFGASFVTARIFVSLFFLATGVGVFKWARAKEDKAFAYYALFLFIIVPPLMKKVRFPNLDIPLMCTLFWGFYFYTKARVMNLWKNWLLVGVFFGLSLLIKGPMGALLPIGICSHFFMCKDIEPLKSVKSWSGLVLGFVIFGLWPLTLFLSDNFQIFLDWYKFTFVITIGKSRGTAEPFYSYLVFLSKQTLPWVILLGIALWRERKNPNFLLPISFFTGIFIFLSMPKFKYSNYIIPLYPYLAISATYGFRSIGKKVYVNAHKGFVGLTFIGALILLVFPLTTKVRRDIGIHSLKDNLKISRVEVQEWLNVGWVYSGVALSSIIAFEEGLPTQSPAAVDLLKKDPTYFKGKVLISSRNDAKILLESFPNLNVVANISKYNVQALMHRDTFSISKPYEY